MKKIIYLIIVILLANLALAQLEVRYVGICNGNEFCEYKETYQNCPQDCLLGGKDGVCDGILDGVCDPDCSSQADPDCVPKISLWQNLFYRNFQKPIAEFQSLRKPMQRAYYTIITGLTIAVISTIVLITILIRIVLITILIKKTYRRKREKIIKQLKKEIKLSPEAQKYYDLSKQQIQNAIRKGFTKKQIKEKMLKKKWPEHIIDEILKKF